MSERGRTGDISQERLSSRDSSVPTMASIARSRESVQPPVIDDKVIQASDSARIRGVMADGYSDSRKGATKIKKPKPPLKLLTFYSLFTLSP